VDEAHARANYSRADSKKRKTADNNANHNAVSQHNNISNAHSNITYSCKAHSNITNSNITYSCKAHNNITNNNMSLASNMRRVRLVFYNTTMICARALRRV
jgi:hypothetical protein